MSDRKLEAYATFGKLEAYATFFSILKRNFDKALLTFPVWPHYQFD